MSLSVPSIQGAKKKPLDVKKLADLTSDTAPRITYVRFEAPPSRKAGVKVADADMLVGKLKDEAKVL